MTEQLLHTPDGVRDIYNGECQRKLAIQNRLHKVMNGYGYRDIQTPTFEFFDIFGKQIGTTPSKDLYKFFDKEGNTLVLRPDFTPSIARSAAKYFSEDMTPVKLCYMGSTFTNSSDYQGRMKETTQCGAELIGDAGTSADAEIIAMAVHSLKECGLCNFQISIGHAELFPELIRACGLDEEAESKLRTMFMNKNLLGAEDFIRDLAIPDSLRQIFLLLCDFDVSARDLAKAQEAAADYPELYAAITNLLELDTFLHYYSVEKYISYELGMLSNFHYYTGIIFTGYTYGTGEPIVKGGRYDRLLSYFGKSRPAIGFAVTADQLLAAISRQNIAISISENTAMLVFAPEKAEEAVKKAMQLRSQGMLVDLVRKSPDLSKDQYVRIAQEKHINRTEFVD